jgi:hypothetical protein
MNLSDGMSCDWRLPRVTQSDAKCFNGCQGCVAQKEQCVAAACGKLLQFTGYASFSLVDTV